MCIFWFNKVCKKYPDNAAGLDQVRELCVWCDDGVGYDGQTRSEGIVELERCFRI